MEDVKGLTCVLAGEGLRRLYVLATQVLSVREACIAAHMPVGPALLYALSSAGDGGLPQDFLQIFIPSERDNRAFFEGGS